MEQSALSTERLDKIITMLLFIYAGLIFLPVAVGNAILDVTILFVGIRLWKRRSDITIEPGLARAFFILFGVVGLSGLLGQNPRHSFLYVWHYIYYSVPLFLGMWFVSSRQCVEKIIKLFLISLFIVSVALIIQGLQGIGRPSTIFGVFVHIFGQFSQLIPFLLTVVLYDKMLSRRTQYAIIAVLVLAGTALIFYAYRGAWMAIIITMTGLILLSIKKRPKFVLVLLGVFLLWVVMTVLVVKTLPYENTVNLITRDSTSVNYRTYLWQSAGRMFMDHPLLGVGVRNFSEQFEKHYVMPDGPEKTIDHAHNTVINILSEMGIAGLLAYLYMMFTIIRHYWRRIHADATGDVLALAALFATLGMIIQGLSDVNFLYFPVVMQTYSFLVGITWKNV